MCFTQTEDEVNTSITNTKRWKNEIPLTLNWSQNYYDRSEI